MAQVNIFVTSFENPLKPALFTDYLSILPPDLKEKNSRYLRWQDRHAHLLGKLLLTEAFKMYGVEEDIWEHLAYNAYQRPYLTDKSYDFNISHSGNFVVCAIGKNTRIGVDIEHNRKVNIRKFRHIMTPGQWQEINGADHKLKTFYKYWTIKESVIKADGRGFFMPLDKLEVRNHTVEYEDNLWYVHELDFYNGYSAALAADRLSTFTLKYVDFYKSGFN